MICGRCCPNQSNPEMAMKAVLHRWIWMEKRSTLWGTKCWFPALWSNQDVRRQSLDAVARHVPIVAFAYSYGTATHATVTWPLFLDQLAQMVMVNSDNRLYGLIDSFGSIVLFGLNLVVVLYFHREHCVPVWSESRFDIIHIWREQPTRYKKRFVGTRISD